MRITMRTTRTGGGRAKFDSLMRRAGQKAEKGLIAAGEVLLDESLKLVPRDTEALADSASITQVGAGMLTVIYVGYGLRYRLGEVIRGPGVSVGHMRHSPKRKRTEWKVPSNYAWIQHFNTALKHDNGQSHYLSEPSITKIPQMRQAFRQKFSEG